MTFVHAIVLFTFGSRVFFGLPYTYYSYTELLMICLYLIISLTKNSSANNKARLLVFIALLSTAAALSALFAYINFEQPMILGLMAKRDLFVSLIPAYFLIYSLGTLNTERVIRNFIFLLKFYIAFSFSVSLLIDPEALNYALFENDQLRLYFVDYSVSLSEYRLKLSPLPGILFLVYFFSDRRKNRTDLFVVALFYIWIVFYYGGRIAVASIVVLHVTLALNSVLTTRGLLKVSLSVILGILLTIVGLMFVPETVLESRIAGFSEAIDAITGANSSSLNDVSSLSRISQFSQLFSRLDAMDYIFGLGQLSTQWYGGFASIFGRFHPSDLGLYGYIGIFGAFGLIILLLALWLVFPKQMTRNKNFLPLLVFLLVYSVPTGLVLFHLPIALICMLILGGAKQSFPAATESTKDSTRLFDDEWLWKRSHRQARSRAE